MIHKTEGVPARGPADIDALSDVMRLLRPSATLLLRGEFSAPWAIEVPGSHPVAPLARPGAARPIVFHVVAEGRCWVETEGGGRERLDAGDAVFFPQARAHAMGAGDGASPVSMERLLPPPPWTGLPVLSHGGGGAPARVVLAYLYCDEPPLAPLLAPLLAGLAPMHCVRPACGGARDWLLASVRYLIEETRRGRPGAACLGARMAELLFTEILRISLAAGAGRGLPAGVLADRHLGRALHALHARPQHGWRLDELARHCALSRSALKARFRRYLGQPPMSYLAAWRVQMAARRLQGTSDTLAAIAADVGYGSEEAFSRAFKRHTGQSPAAWRRERRSSGTASP